MRIRPPFVSKYLFSLLFLFAAFAFEVNAQTQLLWTHKPAQDIKWYSLTDAGTVLVGTDSQLYCLNPENGEAVWKREDLRGINEYETTEVKGTPVLLVTDNTGAVSKKTRLFALDLLTGQTIWQTENLKGSAVNVAPHLEKDMLVFLTVVSNSANKDKPDITALKLSTGELLWHSEYPDKVDLYGIERGSKYFPKFDLSGANPPMFDGDSVYMTYAGLHRYNLSDGKLVWGVKYDVTEGSIKRGNAQALVDGDTVYTSAKGQLRAIDKATGALRWTSKDFGGAIAEMQTVGETLYGRLGGNFYDFGKREFVIKKPFGVVAVDKKSGAPVWRYDDAKESITNMLIMPDQNTIMIADEKNLIGLNMNGKGEVKESFKQKLEFKFNLGTAATVAKVAKFGFGGLSALGSKGGDTTDNPVNISRRENGTVVVRGAQHILAFNPQSHQIVWSTKYAAPGVSGWKKAVMTALTVAAAYMSVNAEASYAAQGFSYSSDRENKNFIGLMSSYEQYMSKRFTATKADGNYTYVLTDIKEEKEKGAGIIGVNMMTGQGERQVMFKDKDPDYEIDELTGRVFNLRNSKELTAFVVR